MNKKMRLVVLVVVLLLCFPVYVTDGSSMLGGLHNGDVLLGCYSKELKRGDIIVFEYSDGNDSCHMVKRIIGVEGDRVCIEDNVLSVNGVVQQEGYLYEPMYTEDLDIIVQKDTVFVMGDNRNVSFDSRVFGCIPEASILSKVVWNVSTVFR